MPEGFHLERPLFAGALTSTFPQRFQEEVGDDGSASWFLQDLASEQESEGCVAISKGRKVGKHKCCEEAEHNLPPLHPPCVRFSDCGSSSQILNRNRCPLSESATPSGLVLPLLLSFLDVCQCLRSSNLLSQRLKSTTGAFWKCIDES
ncbi:hypothetical protein F8388_021716 [Cannabis sativa]|uniref:Uncharacterized protein n=1 Tax=Cannabis sativa TaxID=3483 RepID=A0A7J6E969_CANSA|nr:hypothetical protein F8388_021716 [Cannabis sativa]